MRQTLDGTIWVFAAEALILPTGLVTAAFLTRRLGPEGYGLFALAAVCVAWIEWSVASLFSRATIKFVGEADDWQPVATTVMRLHLAASGSAALLLWLLAAPIGRLLQEPALAGYLRLYAIEIPLFCLASAQRSVLIGIGRFRPRALTSAARWTARMALILLLVGLGGSVSGAILGSIGASLIECLIGHAYLRSRWLLPAPFPACRLCSYAAPLFLSALALRLYEKLDLFVLTALGGAAELAGIYGAAQNLAILPGLVALAFAPLLLSALSRALQRGDQIVAGGMVRDSIRGVIWMLPFAAMTAGAAPEIVGLIFGPRFMPAAPLLALLSFGTVALAMLSVTAAVLTAAGRPNLTLGLAGPMLPMALAGHLLLIPSFGAIGAALVTASVAALVGMVSVVTVDRLWNLPPPTRTLQRCATLATVAYLLASCCPSPGLWLLPKLAAMAAATFLGLRLSGELTAREWEIVRTWTRRERE
jgi:O-antigen/teichoic acid export membrane protein